MTAAALLRWTDVEAVCSWCYAKGKAGEYKITWSFGEREPRHHHFTAASAAKEASRLAGVYPSITFVVLEVVDAYRLHKPSPSSQGEEQ